jgi:hypothetical protein
MKKQLISQVNLELLQKTAGAWGSVTVEELKAEKVRRELELEITRRNKKAW